MRASLQNVFHAKKKQKNIYMFCFIHFTSLCWVFCCIVIFFNNNFIIAETGTGVIVVTERAMKCHADCFELLTESHPIECKNPNPSAFLLLLNFCTIRLLPCDCLSFGNEYIT